MTLDTLAQDAFWRAQLDLHVDLANYRAVIALAQRATRLLFDEHDRLGCGLACEVCAFLEAVDA